MNTFTGICQQGPLAGKVQAHTSTKLPATGGAYYFTPAKGPTPSQWRWVADTKGKTE